MLVRGNRTGKKKSYFRERQKKKVFLVSKEWFSSHIFVSEEENGNREINDYFPLLTGENDVCSMRGTNLCDFFLASNSIR